MLFKSRNLEKITRLYYCENSRFSYYYYLHALHKNIGKCIFLHKIYNWGIENLNLKSFISKCNTFSQNFKISILNLGCIDIDPYLRLTRNSHISPPPSCRAIFSKTICKWNERAKRNDRIWVVSSVKRFSNRKISTCTLNWNIWSFCPKDKYHEAAQPSEMISGLLQSIKNTNEKSCYRLWLSNRFRIM